MITTDDKTLRRRPLSATYHRSMDGTCTQPTDVEWSSGCGRTWIESHCPEPPTLNWPAPTRSLCKMSRTSSLGVLAMLAVLSSSACTSADAGARAMVLPPPPPPPPLPEPKFPTPAWSWDTIPLAFHGANKTGMFTKEAVQQLARYRMVTVSGLRRAVLGDPAGRCAWSRPSYSPGSGPVGEMVHALRCAPPTAVRPRLQRRGEDVRNLSGNQGALAEQQRDHHYHLPELHVQFPLVGCAWQAVNCFDSIV